MRIESNCRVASVSSSRDINILRAKRWIRIIGGIVLATLGASLLYPFPPLGIALIITGFGIAIYQSFQMWGDRFDPYDLSRLYKTLPDEPEETDDTDR